MKINNYILLILTNDVLSLSLDSSNLLTAEYGEKQIKRDIREARKNWDFEIYDFPEYDKWTIGDENFNVFNPTGDEDLYYHGAGGNDFIGPEGSGNMVLFGGPGDNIMMPYSTGNVYVDGGEGNDSLSVWMLGTNTMVGGSGQNTFTLFGSI